MKQKKDCKQKKPEDSSSSDKKDQQRERRRRIFSRIAKVAAGFIVVSITATEAMMFVMFGRTDPTQKTPFEILDWANCKNYRAHALEFRSGENRISGYVIIPPFPIALILIVHGVHSSSDALEPVARYFAERSYAVMSFDGTASGRSEGIKTVGLQQQRYDIRAALDYIHSEPELTLLPLIMLGHSAGAYGVAVEAQNSGAAAVVCVSGFDSPLGTMKFWAEHYAGMLTNVEYPFLWIREYAAKGKDANESASQALSQCMVPALVVHGDNDEVIPMDISLYQGMLDRESWLVSQILVTDTKFNKHSNILVANQGVNRALLEEILQFLENRL